MRTGLAKKVILELGAEGNEGISMERDKKNIPGIGIEIQRPQGGKAYLFWMNFQNDDGVNIVTEVINT